MENMENEVNLKWYDKNWFLWVLLVLAPYAGIPFMWIRKKEFSTQKKSVLSVVFALWLFAAIGMNGADKVETKPSNNADTTVVAAETEPTASEKSDETPIAEPEPEPEPEPETFVNTAEKVELFTGDFMVGKDVVPGRYVITTTDRSGNFFVYDPDEYPIVNEVLSKSADDLGVKMIEVDLVEGYKISISGLNKVVLSPATIEQKTTLTAGIYFVGRDVPAGDYIATTKDRGGNFFVYDSNGYPKVNEILGKGDLGVEKVKFSTVEGDIIQIAGMNEVVLGE